MHCILSRNVIVSDISLASMVYQERYSCVLSNLPIGVPLVSDYIDKHVCRYPYTNVGQTLF